MGICTPATALRTCPEGIKGVALTRNADTVAEAEWVFHALLADGGTVTMALQETFWAKGWRRLVDRFGTSWMVNGERLPF
jgi:PhnB protein